MKDAYDAIMNIKINALKHLPFQVKFMSMQVLAWMWCIIFSMWMGSILVFGVSAIVHALLIAGVFVTAATFETARRKPEYFGGLGRGGGGEHE